MPKKLGMGTNTKETCSSDLPSAQGYKAAFTMCRTYFIHFRDFVLHVIQVFVLLDSQHWKKKKETLPRKCLSRKQANKPKSQDLQLGAAQLTSATLHKDGM